MRKLLIVVAMTFVATLGVAQDKKDPPPKAKDVYVVIVKDGKGGDTVIIVEGLDWKAIPSDRIKDVAKPEVDGNKLIIRGRRCYPVTEEASHVTLKLVGTVTKGVEVGIPAGVPVYFGSREKPK